MTPRTPDPRAAGRILAAVAVALVLTVAGCAGHDPAGQAGETSPSGSPGSTTSAGPTPRSSPPTTPPTTPSAPGRSTSPTSPTPPTPPTSAPSQPAGPVLTLTGVARHGVEPGCVVFDTGNRHLYLLLGTGGASPDQKNIPLGVPLRVRGVQVDQIVSYCQQGIPLEVIDVSRR